MAGFITELTSVLGIDLVLGTTTMSLGGIALAAVLVKQGLSFFKALGGRR